MDQIISDVKTINVGYQMGSRKLKILCFADGAVLLTDNEDVLRLLYRFKTISEEYNMKLSIGKPKQW
jgi:hypothetical protein